FLASNGTPIMVEFAFFGVSALRSGLTMSIAARSPAPPIAVRCIKLRREISRDSLSLVTVWPPTRCGPVRRILVLHQILLSFTPVVCEPQTEIILLGRLSVRIERAFNIRTTDWTQRFVLWARGMPAQPSRWTLML